MAAMMACIVILDAVILCRVQAIAFASRHRTKAFRSLSDAVATINAGDAVIVLARAEHTPVTAISVHPRAIPLVEHALKQVFTIAPSSGSVSLTSPGAIPCIGLVVDAIGRRFRERRLTSRAIAREIGVSQEHLCRLVKRATGTSFRVLLNDRRVAEALRLVISGGLSIKQIAWEVGYGDTRRLDEQFKARYGCCPSDATVDDPPGESNGQ